ncbi:hypothetical protein XENORESO_011854 [Xenotaenia resolanae]|uniref:Uncharacterized protein n=1 Tax=Xenotaenia resolanae TaxID=208358 RepID=A0ABV0VYV8_9TELE
MCIKYLSLKELRLMNSGEENIQSRRPRKSKDCLEFTENLISVGIFPGLHWGASRCLHTPEYFRFYPRFAALGAVLFSLRCAFSPFSSRTTRHNASYLLPGQPRLKCSS